jgi:hypothetical protein
LASSTTKAVINFVIDAIGAATSELREYKMEESLESTMSTEFDLSFGVGAGFAVAVKAHTQRSAPSNAAAGTRRPQLSDAIAFLAFEFSRTS